jgi:hypothetical protein
VKNINTPAAKRVGPASTASAIMRATCGPSERAHPSQASALRKKRFHFLFVLLGRLDG